MFDSRLGQFLQSVDPGLRACSDGKGRYWVEDSEGKEVEAKNLPFTPEEVAAWVPPAPDPDKVPAPSLEVGDYKTLDAALEAASTVAQVKAVFRAYLRKRAGL